jgi:hypothetical protein
MLRASSAEKSAVMDEQNKCGKRGTVDYWKKPDWDPEKISLFGLFWLRLCLGISQSGQEFTKDRSGRFCIKSCATLIVRVAEPLSSSVRANKPSPLVSPPYQQNSQSTGALFASNYRQLVLGSR